MNPCFIYLRTYINLRAYINLCDKHGVRITDWGATENYYGIPEAVQTDQAKPACVISRAMAYDTPSQQVFDRQSSTPSVVLEQTALAK